MFDDEYVGPVSSEERPRSGSSSRGHRAPWRRLHPLRRCCSPDLPPLPGFIGKFAIMAGLIPRPSEHLAATWSVIGADHRLGPRDPGRVRRARDRPVLGRRRSAPGAAAGRGRAGRSLLAACLALTVFAGPAMARMERTGRVARRPAGYIEAVLGAPLHAREGRRMKRGSLSRSLSIASCSSCGCC